MNSEPTISSSSRYPLQSSTTLSTKSCAECPGLKPDWEPVSRFLFLQKGIQLCIYQSFKHHVKFSGSPLHPFPRFGMLAPQVLVEGVALSVDQIRVPQHIGAIPAMLEGVCVHSLPPPVSCQDIIETFLGEVSCYRMTVILFLDLFFLDVAAKVGMFLERESWMEVWVNSNLQPWRFAESKGCLLLRTWPTSSLCLLRLFLMSLLLGNGVAPELLVCCLFLKSGVCLCLCGRDCMGSSFVPVHFHTWCLDKKRLFAELCIWAVEWEETGFHCERALLKSSMVFCPFFFVFQAYGSNDCDPASPRSSLQVSLKNLASLGLVLLIM